MVKKLKIGMKAEIYISNEENMKNYATQVEDIIGDIIILGAPLEKGRIVSVAEGTEIKVGFVESETVFCFKARVLRLIRKKLPLLLVKKEGQVKKIQRRDFYRLRTLIPIKYKLIGNDASDNMAEDIFDGIVKDISGGGILMLTEKKLKENDVILIQLKLRDYGKHQIKGRVVRINTMNSTADKIEVGIMFEELDDKTRDNIIAFIFKEQRLLRKKGLI